MKKKQEGFKGYLRHLLTFVFEHAWIAWSFYVLSLAIAARHDRPIGLVLILVAIVALTFTTSGYEWSKSLMAQSKDELIDALYEAKYAASDYICTLEEQVKALQDLNAALKERELEAARSKGNAGKSGRN
jgi:hypothetical protein